ncbi:unnamed protein product [Nezara viridula]|uniref:Uncharacterized protein n=1 Tax=Nezara viridula TaxID=85310 RepID=A0A9P0HJK3_NEZVI|nr:unnamed protein product [Nezara viridula]
MDDTMMTLPPSDRGRWNREVGEEIWRRKKAHDDIRKKDEMIKNTDCGIPNLPAIRRRVKYSDPELRFQNHPDVRRSVDIHWRYGFLPEIKASYRLELERQMAEKQQRRAEEWRRRLQQEVQKGMTTDFGRTGPGGHQWRHPAKVGMNFLHSLGWTGEKAFRRLEDQIDQKGKVPKQLMINDKAHESYSTPEEALTGGIELVPLMARRRSFKKSSHLPTCDVTNAAITHGKEAWQDTSGPVDYLRDLNAQVNMKRGQVKADKEEDVKTAQRHFETWNSLWGRPGHGAPRAGGAKGKGNLGRLLYQETGVLWPASGQRVR